MYITSKIEQSENNEKNKVIEVIRMEKVIEEMP